MSNLFRPHTSYVYVCCAYRPHTSYVAGYFTLRPHALHVYVYFIWRPHVYICVCTIHITIQYQKICKYIFYFILCLRILFYTGTNVLYITPVLFVCIRIFQSYYNIKNTHVTTLHMYMSVYILSIY